MIIFLLLLAALSVVCLLAVLLLGFCLGNHQQFDRLSEVRLQAAHAQRSMHDLTRQTFIAMAEEFEQHRSRNSNAPQ